MATGSSFIPQFLNGRQSYTSSQQVRHATTSATPLASTISLYDRYAEKKDQEKEPRSLNATGLQGPAGRRPSSPELEALEVANLMLTLDIKREKEEDGNVPPKPQVPSNFHFKKTGEGLISPTSSAQTAVRFTKQDIIGVLEKFLKRV